MYKKLKLLGLFALLATGSLYAQTENSPYSRYGIGDALPSQNIMLRGIGGVSAAYADLRSVNYTNPASYSKIKLASFDFGLEVDSRTLKVIDPPRKFNSVSPIISYIQLGLPISKKHNWGMNIGLRPVTRINYSLERNERLPDIDSVHTLFEGNGGAYEVYTGTGISIKNFSIGFNVGYLFGTKDYSTERNFVPDSSFKFYYGSQYATNSNFGGIFANAGVQYGFKIGKNDMLRFGAYGNLKRQYSASRDRSIITYQENESGVDTIDVISKTSESGKIVYPSKYGVGLMYFGGESWLIGADYEKTAWNEYRFFDETDLVQDSWMFHVGGQIIPNYINPKSYWATVIYRGGFFYGKDYINVEQHDLPVWGASLGMGLPMRRQNYSNQSSIINMTFEFGQRGNNANVIRENFFRVAVGLNLSDIWFIKKQYD